MLYLGKDLHNRLLLQSNRSLNPPIFPEIPIDINSIPFDITKLNPKK